MGEGGEIFTEAEVILLLGGALTANRQVPTIRRSILPPSSG